MKTVKPGQRVLHQYLGPGTVKALHEEFKDAICYFKPDFVPERFLGLQMVYVSALEGLKKACSSENASGQHFYLEPSRYVQENT